MLQTGRLGKWRWTSAFWAQLASLPEPSSHAHRSVLCLASFPPLCPTSFPNPHTFKVSYSGHWDHLKLSFSSGLSSLGQRTAVSRLPPCLKSGWLASHESKGETSDPPFSRANFCLPFAFHCCGWSSQETLGFSSESTTVWFLNVPSPKGKTDVATVACSV